MNQKRPGGDMKPARGSPELTKSRLNPLSAKAGDLLKREYFWPILITTLVVVLIWYFLDHPRIGIVYRGYNIPMHSVLLTGYLSFVGFFVILKFAGKRPNWLMIAFVGAIVCLDFFYHGPLLTLCIKFFRHALMPLLGLPDKLPDGATFLLSYARSLFNAGLMEEVYKALPTIALLLVGLSNLSPWNQRIGVREPLDGIICGAMAGACFTFIETGFNHLPGYLKSGNVVGQLTALQVLAPRTLGEFAGHVGYAGYAGYFIGLAALHPEKKWRLIAIGVGSAAAVHALWNSADKLGELASFLPAVLAIFMLGSAILKAREISPNRSQLAASQIIGGLSNLRVPDFLLPSPAIDRTGNPPIAIPRSETWDDGSAGLTLAVGTARVPVSLGARLYERQAPGTSAQRGDGIVAEVNANPNDPGVLGLKNLSNQTWDVTTDKGEHRELSPGRSIRVTRGTRIQLGDLVAEVK